MNILIVFAHPEPKSFNAAMKNTAVTTLMDQGHSVKVSDLYEMNFNPVVGRGDFLQMKNPDYFHYLLEQAYASDTEGFAKDIADEQAKIKWADLIIFQFPLWWTDPPAILKGWFDRVLAYKFAYAGGHRFEKGLLKGKKAMLSITTGGSPDEYGEGSRKGPLLDRLYSVHHEKLFYCGLEVLEPFVGWGVQSLSEEERELLLKEYAALLIEIDDVPFLSFYQPV
ncbi:NAD(P)H-dependent oxidoreductase [Bacillus sp. JJ1122]|uniref:NAD(P)H-dependent oxidoreductase n=1 Tax=Bacillus sp. JJ1122 TaxID=3122951 RepID=UPI002FFEE39F